MTDTTKIIEALRGIGALVEELDGETLLARWGSAIALLTTGELGNGSRWRQWGPKLVLTPEQARAAVGARGSAFQEKAAGSRRDLERAFRVRAGMIGELASCLCLHPVTKYETTSGHDERCPSHGLWLSRQRVKELYPNA